MVSQSALEETDASAPNLDGLNAIYKSDFTELKALSSPPQLVVDVTAAVVALHLNAPVSDWNVCKQALGDSTILMSLKTMPQRMQDGKDFSKGLRQAKSILDAGVTHGEVKRKSAACANLLLWLQAIVQVGGS